MVALTAFPAAEPTGATRTGAREEPLAVHAAAGEPVRLGDKTGEHVAVAGRGGAVAPERQAVKLVKVGEQGAPLEANVMLEAPDDLRAVTVRPDPVGVAPLRRPADVEIERVAAAVNDARDQIGAPLAQVAKPPELDPSMGIHLTLPHAGARAPPAVMWGPLRLRSASSRTTALCRRGAVGGLGVDLDTAHGRRYEGPHTGS